MSIELIIIGLGNHTKNKIIPSLKELSVPIKALITNTKLTHYDGIPIFNDISNIKDKNSITHFVISTTPAQQIKHIKLAALMNIKTFVEKPAFISKEDLETINFVSNSKFSLTEGMMYRFGAGYKYVFNKLGKEKVGNHELSINFVLPNKDGILLNTFRSKVDVKNSIIYDIGSYVFDFLWTLKIFDFQMSNIQIELFPNRVLKRLKFILKPSNNDYFTNINVDMGYGNYYKNEIHFNSKDHQFEVSPFFWGRFGKVNIKETRANKKPSIKITNTNALSEMLLKWLNSNNNVTLLDLQNFDRYNFVISQLLILERKIF